MKTLIELKKLDEAKLKTELLDISKKLAKIRFDVDNGHAKNHHEIKNYRAQIARIKTLMTQMRSTVKEEPVVVAEEAA